MLTPRQRQIWDFLVDYGDRHGYPPTVREIGEAVGLASPSTVHAHLANLERAGLLRRDPTKPRALELIGRERQRRLAADARDARAPAGRPDRCRRTDAGRGVDRGLSRRAGTARARRRRVHPSREGRVDGQRRHPRRRLRRRPPSAGRAERRRRRGARRAQTRPPTRRPSSGSSARTAASASSRRTTRSSRSTQRTSRSWARSSGSSGGSSGGCAGTEPVARPGAARAPARRQPRVPRVRRVRAATAGRLDLLSGMRLFRRTPAPVGFRMQAG